MMPFGEVWEECCRRADVPDEAQWIKEAESYDKKVLAKRA
jgi:L-rhamnose isomerase